MFTAYRHKQIVESFHEVYLFILYYFICLFFPSNFTVSSITQKTDYPRL